MVYMCVHVCAGLRERGERGERERERERERILKIVEKKTLRFHPLTIAIG